MTEVDCGALAVGTPGHVVCAAAAVEYHGYDIALFAGAVLPTPRG